MRALVLRLHLVAVAVAAILVAMLAMGRGLPGIVRALQAERSHVCTCATGGDHASCPVCNGTIASGEHRRSSSAEAKGVPCGEGRFAVTACGEPGTLPSAIGVVLGRVERVDAPRTPGIAVPDVLLEPATPPPRSAAT
jgi:hypothetical protein